MIPTIEESRRRQERALAGLLGTAPAADDVAATEPSRETAKADFYALTESGKPVAQLVLAKGADATDAAAFAARNGWKVVPVEVIDTPRHELRERQRTALADLTGGSAAAVEAALPYGSSEISLPSITVHKQADRDRFSQELKETSEKVEATKRKLDAIAAKTGKSPLRESGSGGTQEPVPVKRYRSTASGDLIEIRGA